jgi:hypothetical protein
MILLPSYRVRMKAVPIHYVVIGVLAVAIAAFYVGRRSMPMIERFDDFVENDGPCSSCSRPRPCGCPAPAPRPQPQCAECKEPDPSKWVLKATVPPCPPMPDMSKYMLKTECPPQPDMSKYVLKSSVPNCPPCISTCSKPCKIGECPPCPRPRCPVVKCPEPRACPACPAAMCAPCPEPNIKCKAAYEPGTPVRPMLASTSTFGF